MSVLMPACLERDLDVASGQCTAVIWIPQPSLLPELGVEEAMAIGQAIAYLLAVAYAFRLVRKALKQS